MKIDLGKVERLYSENIKKFGIHPKSVGWKDESSHKLRFKKLIEVIDERDKNESITINELGCGYGAMYFYLIEDAKLKISKYVGYDISEEMLNSAKSIIKNGCAEFIKSDKILYKADYSFSSGIFNVKFDIEEKLWENYIRDILINMNEKSLKGFAFNCLTTYVDYKEDCLYYGNPLYFFDLCKKHFSKKVSLLHDYELFEWTIIVKK
ncbi:MAG: class I SAM-dependent methyltransferase [Candidatus Aenigmatarchaeota archaeon]